ncbi:Uncharacterised protein [Streptococcus pneumoniae]|nr:Uncharacterised protein [Streptococcus pneumoniae]
MSARFRFFLIKTCTTNNHFFLVLNISIQNLTKRQNFRYTILDSEHIETKIGLHLGHFEEVIENNIG